MLAIQELIPDHVDVQRTVLCLPSTASGPAKRPDGMDSREFWHRYIGVLYSESRFTAVADAVETRAMQMEAARSDQDALLAAAQADDVLAARAIIDATPKGSLAGVVDLPDDNGWTPLMIAAQRGAAPLAAVLLGAGAEVDRAGYKDGLTALSIAADKDSVDVAR
jgi:hypothetical protein